MNEDRIYPSMVIRCQAETIELLEQENKQLKDNWNKLKKELIKELKFQRKLSLPVSTYCVSVIDVLINKINCLDLEGKSE